MIGESANDMKGKSFFGRARIADAGSVDQFTFLTAARFATACTIVRFCHTIFGTNARLARIYLNGKSSFSRMRLASEGFDGLSSAPVEVTKRYSATLAG